METRATAFGVDKVYAKKVETRERVIDGRKVKVTAKAEFYSLGGTQQPYFSVTVENAWEILPRGGRRNLGCGCMHDLIEKVFPEWKHMLKWHLVSADKPMHYVENSMYHASEKDCWGFLKGQQKTDKKSGLPLWSIRPQPLHSYTQGATREEAIAAYVNTLIVEPVVGEGKVPEFNHFRSAAVWPDISDAQIIELRDSGKLKEALVERLPALMDQFYNEMQEFFGCEDLRGAHKV